MTVLKNLAKIKHPVVYGLWKKVATDVPDKTWRGLSRVLSNVNDMTNSTTDELVIDMRFHPKTKLRIKYIIKIRATSFDISIEKYYDGNWWDDPVTVMSMLEMKYENFEEMIFQHLTTQQYMGMIGTQELEMINEIRDIYFKE